MKTSGEQLETANKAGSGAHLECAPECMEVFQALKIKRKHTYIIFKVGAETIDVEKVSERGASYDELKKCLPFTDCRFAVYDHEKMDRARGVPVSKLWFIVWNPNNASTYNKMAYTAAKQKLFAGLSAALLEVTVRSAEELDSALGLEAEESDESDMDL